MKVVISSFGSSGDFNPCLGLGRALIRERVDVIFLSNPFYEKKIIDAGLKFHPAGEYWDVFQEIQDNPDYLHPRRGPKKVWDLVLETVPVMYSAMSDLISREKPDIAACHILEFGGMTASINQQTPYAVLCPNPMSFFNTHQPGYLNFKELPYWIRRFQGNAMHGLMNIAFRHSLKPHCGKNNIQNSFESIDQVFSKSAINLGLWSTLLKEASVDDPPNSKICGFVRDAHVCDWDDIPAEILDLFDSAKKPVVVGLGSTASLHGDMIYQHMAEVCNRLNQPCLLVGKNYNKYANPDKGVLAIDFAPYGWVFPRAAMVIHHGGLNTTAEALRAGIPALVIPHGYDQFDNAIRTGHLGVSKRLKTSDVAAGDKLMTVISSILKDTQMHDRAKQFSIRLQSQPDGAETAAQAIIDVIGNRAL